MLVLKVGETSSDHRTKRHQNGKTQATEKVRKHFEQRRKGSNSQMEANGKLLFFLCIKIILIEIYELFFF